MLGKSLRDGVRRGCVFGPADLRTPSSQSFLTFQEPGAPLIHSTLRSDKASALRKAPCGGTATSKRSELFKRIRSNGLYVALHRSSCRITICFD